MADHTWLTDEAIFAFITWARQVGEDDIKALLEEEKKWTTEGRVYNPGWLREGALDDFLSRCRKQDM